MKGRLRALINSATGEITLPLTLTSRIARSKSVDCASRIASLISPASAATLIAKFLQHVRDHHPDHYLVLNEEY